MSDDGNVLDKASGTAESSNKLVYSLIALFATLIVAAAFCNGAANLGLGKVLGDGWRSVGAVISDTYCASLGQPAESCPTVGENMAAWWGKTKREQGLKLAGVDEAAVPDDSGLSQPSGAENEVVVPAVVVGPTGPSQGLIDAVALATTNWQTTQDVAAARSALELAAAQHPTEVASYAPYAALKGKVDAFEAIWQDLQTKQSALWDGTIADPQEFINAVKAYQDACAAFDSATGNLSSNTLVDTCEHVGTTLFGMIKVYVDATAEGADPTKFAEIVTPSWHTTTWTITKYDDRAGSCHCATLVATGPQWIDGLTLPQVPAEALSALFPDQTGPLTEEVGQEITWP